MLKLLQNIFFPTPSKDMSFYQLHSSIVRWRKSGYPYEYELPNSISFDDKFWKKIIRLHKDTKTDGLERAISIWWVDGELVVTSVTVGSESRVTTRNKVVIRYVPHPTRKEYYKREIVVDDNIYSSKDVYHKKVPKKLERPDYLFNMHTHPPHGDQYSFFSLQDLRSMLSTRAVITGMISDRMWLLFRTNKTPTVLNNFEERNITKETLTKQLNLGVYEGEFNGKLQRTSL